MWGLALTQKIEQGLGQQDLPISVYTGKELTKQEQHALTRLTEAVIIKDVKSPERLLDETSLFLHRPPTNLPSNKRQMLEQVQTDSALSGKRALIIDDDIRNIFALTSI